MTTNTESQTFEQIYKDALDFATAKHQGQFRKGSDDPYIVHPIGVAAFILEIGQVSIPDVIRAAILHDTLEDTETTYDELVAHFGSTVADLVKEVTDDKSLQKYQIKINQIEKVKKCSDGAKLIKMADKLYNLMDLISCPIWEPERVQGYFAWAWLTLEPTIGLNAPLEAALNDVFGQSFEYNGVKYQALPKTRDLIVANYDRYIASLMASQESGSA